MSEFTPHTCLYLLILHKIQNCFIFSSIFSTFIFSEDCRIKNGFGQKRTKKKLRRQILSSTYSGYPAVYCVYGGRNDTRVAAETHIKLEKCPPLLHPLRPTDDNHKITLHQNC